MGASCSKEGPFSRELLFLPDDRIHSAVTHNLPSGLSEVKIDFRFCKIRDIIRIDAFSIILPGIFLRKQERFGDMPLSINTGKIETSIQSVPSPTGKDKPMTVDIPVME